MKHEEALIRAFITPDKRQRYLDRLRSAKTRKKFMNKHFHHMSDKDVVGHNDGTFISCIPGRLAYFEGEGLNERYVLQRPG
jgi:hypothetical protein